MNKAAALAVLLAAAGPAAAEDGAAAFAAVCSACHGEGGVGIPGLAPPLAGNDALMALGEGADAYVAGVMAAGLSGRITVNGEDYIGLVMPPQAYLPTEALAAVLTYVLTDLNDLPAPDAPAEAVEAAKAAPPSHKALREMRKGS